MATRPDVRVRRVYDDAEDQDGARILVDRIWPRGMSKDRAKLDEWCKEIAPSTDLRKWYSHDPIKFMEFARRYRAELEEGEPAEALKHLQDLTSDRRLTLMTGTIHPEISEAEVLRHVLRR